MGFSVYFENVVPEEELCPHCRRPLSDAVGDDGYFSGSITHNLNQIVERCLHHAAALLGAELPVGLDPARGYREYSWGRLNGHRVADVLAHLRAALTVAWTPEREGEFRQLEPENGWGKFEDVRELLSQIITAGDENPTALIRASG